jgi:hypothetical protein
MRRHIRIVCLSLLTFAVFATLAYPAYAQSDKRCAPATNLTKWLLQGSRVTMQQGWTLVRLKGTPYQIGFQRCYLTAQNTDYWIRSYDGEPGDRPALRVVAKNYIWPLIPWEYKQELMGEAAGLRAGLQALGSKLDDQAGLKGQSCADDLWDLVAANAWSELDTYAQLAPAASAAAAAAVAAVPATRCSAFIATGDATTDGLPVMGHATWSGYNSDFMYSIMYDVHPIHGYEFSYQGCGGSIWSGEDWYVNSAGLLLCETTLSDSVTDPTGMPIFVRARQAIQYDRTVGQVIRTFLHRNNGAYPNEWLIGDRTGEIASLQLGCKVYDLNRTRNGFFGSSNFNWGPNIRQEDGSPTPDPASSGYARYIRWGQLKTQYYGKVDAAIGMKMLADTYDTYLMRTYPSSRTLCGERELETVGTPRPSGAYDGKVTTERMVLRGMKIWARWGHPNGDAFDAQLFLNNNPTWAANASSFDLLGLSIFSSTTPNPWTLIGRHSYR